MKGSSQCATSTSRVPGKRGRRPKCQAQGQAAPKASTRTISKITEAINNHPGEPIIYASTTKGTMKLVVDGHHFRYSFRKGKYTIFQCCYKENKEECLVRVVTDQKLVYPLDGEHIHFVQATDKSATSVKFSLANIEPEREHVTITNIENLVSNQPDKEQHTITLQFDSSHGEDSVSSGIRSRIFNPGTSMKKSTQKQQQAAVNMGEFIPRPIETDVKVENTSKEEALEFTAEMPSEKSSENSDAISSEEFREKIKKRLQKALLGKKK